MLVLVVDDELINRELLEDYLGQEGIQSILASDGKAGWELLQKEYSKISLVLLDRMMPEMGGIEFIKRMKTYDNLKDIPVILQTAVADTASIVEGIDSGAYYYLTKPYKKDILMSVVHAAANDSRYKSEIINEVRKNKKMLGLLQEAYFEFSTVEEAQDLAYFLANSFPDPERVILGLSEVMINAIEHGHLGINYQEKGKLLVNGNLIEEIAKRQKIPANAKKKAKLHFTKNDREVVVNIKDEGNGFNWEEFLEIKPGRVMNPNGRGILMARSVSFDELSYIGNGNEVCCKVFLKK